MQEGNFLQYGFVYKISPPTSLWEATRTVHNKMYEKVQLFRVQWEASTVGGNVSVFKLSQCLQILFEIL